jgi:hypothetical protein
MRQHPSPPAAKSSTTTTVVALAVALVALLAASRTTLVDQTAERQLIRQEHAQVLAKIRELEATPVTTTALSTRQDAAGQVVYERCTSSGMCYQAHSASALSDEAILPKRSRSGGIPVVDFAAMK